jgi:polysaccharide biosynthesis protein PelF
VSRAALPKLGPGKTADVTLLLEGTYPFVSGGVSSWVHQIITGLPDLDFALVSLGGSPEAHARIRYALPKNVVHVEEHFLSEVPKGQRLLGIPGDAGFYAKSQQLHDELRCGGEALGRRLEGVVGALLDDPARHERDFLFSEASWNEICRRYEGDSRSRSFLEYFWTIRSMHAPLFMLARVAAQLPASRSLHVISTGFAGFLGMLAQKKRRVPLILTEHGIYAKERRIELLQAEWIRDDDDGGSGIGFFRQMWIADGAEPAKTRIVPNGIDLKRFGALRERRSKEVPPVLGLIGRVVPIKDIKTFLRALRVVVSEMPHVEGIIVGPDDEDRSYAEECKHLAGTLGLEKNVRFLGFQKVDDVFPRIGLNVLTSISEAQPLVVLEGFAAGVPCVSTDVGCVRELLDGAGDDDRALGVAGSVVGIASPEATARAAMELLRDPARWRAAQAAGIRRAETLYGQELMLQRYRRIYETAIGRA